MRWTVGWVFEAVAHVGTGQVYRKVLSCGRLASVRYSGVPGTGIRGLPINSSSSSLEFAPKRSTSDQSFTLLLDISSIRRFGSRSMPACTLKHAVAGSLLSTPYAPGRCVSLDPGLVWCSFKWHVGLPCDTSKQAGQYVYDCSSRQSHGNLAIAPSPASPEDCMRSTAAAVSQIFHQIPQVS